MKFLNTLTYYMEKKDFIRLEHMLDAAHAACRFLSGKQREALDRDDLLASAVVRQLEILGEAANAISEKTQLNYSHIPWRKIVDMRNLLIHAYHDVDLDIVWLTVSNAIPSLIKDLEQILEQLRDLSH